MILFVVNWIGFGRLKREGNGLGSSGEASREILVVVRASVEEMADDGVVKGSLVLRLDVGTREGDKVLSIFMD